MGLFRTLTADGGAISGSPLSKKDAYLQEQYNKADNVGSFLGDVDSGLSKFFGSFKDDPDKREDYVTMGNMLNEFTNSMRFSDLAATAIATSPFVKTNATKAYMQGVGGFDPIEKFSDAYALREQRKERDRRESALAKQMGQDKSDIVTSLSNLSSKLDSLLKKR